MNKKQKFPPDYFATNLSDVSLDFLQTVFAQAQSFLSEQLKSGEGITEKAHKVLGITLTIMTGCLLYSIEADAEKNAIIYIAAILSCVTTLIATIKLIPTIKAYHTHVVGSQPIDLLSVDFVENVPAEQQTKRLLYSELANYQNRIIECERINLKRSKRVDFAIYLLASLPANVIIASLFAYVPCIIFTSLNY